MHRRRGAALGSALVGVAVALLLLTGCVPATHLRGDAHPQRLPLGLPNGVVLGCERSVGLDDSTVAPTFWRDSQGVHLRIGHGTRHGTGIGSGGGLSNTESALLSCLTLATGPLPKYPTDSAGLLLLWKYSTTVLWPCIGQHGVDLGQPPSRAEVLSGDPMLIDPYAQLHAQLSAARLAQLSAECPALPSYLAPASR
ncbi:MAG TPA: hypothetical protein VFQ74_07630 [Pseudolysinimonas sp.]|nr:hypothetical protein [Pseudolysinimonas sp.]